MTIKDIATRAAGTTCGAALICSLLLATSALAADVDITTDTTIGINLDTLTGNTAEVFSGVTVSNDINGTLIGTAYSAIGAPTTAWILTNRGTVSIPNTAFSGPAVRFAASGAVANYGLIEALTNNAIELTAGGAVDNFADGEIRGALAGIQIGNGSGSVTNAGYIQSLGGGGINLLAGGSVVNHAGGIVHTEGNSNVGVYVIGGTSRSIVNSGVIESVGGSFATGIEIGNGDGSIANNATGSIYGTYNGIYTGSSGNLSIQNAGTISSLNGPAIEFRTTGTITNNGTIEKIGGGNAITFAGDHIRTLILGTGSQIIGNVVGGTSGTDNLVLQGTGTESITRFTNFETLAMQGEAWTLTGTASFATSATVSEGLLSLDGTLTTPILTVDTGAILGGIGTLAGDILANGIVAPGNSIGTLTVDGDATFGAGSTFRVEIEPLGTSDFLDVSGTVTVAGGAQINVLKQVGTYTAGTEWRILTAGTGITGTFDDPVLQSAPMLNLAVEYRPAGGSAEDIWLVLLSDAVIGVIDIAETPNQIATAVAIDDLGGEVLDAFAGMDEDTARAALDNLSGEIHATAFGAAFDSPWFREGMLARLREAHGEGRPNPPALAFASDHVDAGAGGGGVDGPGWQWWAVRPDAYLASARFGDDGNAAAARVGTGGLMIGADRTAGDVTLGFAGGYQSDTVSVPDRASTADLATWNLGAYGGWTGSDGWRARGGLAAAWHSFDTTREILVPGLESTAEAHYSGWSGQAFGEVGRGFAFGGATIEPYAGFRMAHLSRAAFSETGAGPADLSAQAERLTAAISTLGINLTTTVPLADGRQLTPRAGIAWEHAFTDMTPSADLMFWGGTDSFHILGPTHGRDTFRLDAGIDVTLSPTASAFVSYQGRFAAGASAQAIRGGATVRF